MNAMNAVNMNWNGWPPHPNYNDLVYRPTYTGDTIEVAPQPWVPLRPQYNPPMPTAEEQAQAAENLRRLLDLLDSQRASLPPLEAAPAPVATPSPAEKDTSDSFRPQRKLDLDV
jgi:hypothetical protein